MSNRLSINPCKFVDYDVDGVEVGTSYGYRIFDDYDRDYNNLSCDSIENVLDILKPGNVLKVLKENHPDFHDYIVEDEKGITIGEEWFDFDKLT